MVGTVPSFFSWQLETVLFFLKEKEKNGFKKAFLWVRQKTEEAGGQSSPPLQVRCKIEGCTVSVKCCLTAIIKITCGAAEYWRLQRCTATAPRPSSVCFADTFPGGEGIPLRRGRADRAVRPYRVRCKQEVRGTGRCLGKGR